MARIFQIKRGLKANLPALAQGEFAMTTDSGAEALWLGTGNQNKKIPLNPAAADVGAVALDGSGAMTGTLRFSRSGLPYGTLSANASNAYLSAYTGDDGEANRRMLKVKPVESAPEFKYALTFSKYVNGAESEFGVFHGANKPSGSYTGNASASRDPIDTGGIGNVLAIMSNNSVNLITPAGGVQFNCTTGAVTYASKSEINFTDGVLTIATASFLNTANAIYTYQVL